MLHHSLSGLKTPVTAAAIQTAPPVTHRQTAATRPALLQMTATAAVTAMMTALPLRRPPPHPLIAQTQEAAAIQIKDLQKRKKRRNEYMSLNKWGFLVLFSWSHF